MAPRTPDLILAEMVAQYALQIAHQRAELERQREELARLTAENAAARPHLVKAE